MASSPDTRGRHGAGTATGGHRFARVPAATWVALSYLGLFVAGQGTYLLLGASARAAFAAFASTSVANLTRDPVGCLVTSAFVTGGDLSGTLTWLPLIAIALWGAVRAVGTWRAVGVIAAGHIMGTLVSQGIIAWRVSSGALPDSYRHMIDVGPSYVVVSALTLALALAPWPWRLAAAAGMLLLIFPGQIFSGLTGLAVAAVGHAVAIAAALLLAAATGIASRRSRAA